MIKIRNGAFETNSSSTHAMIIHYGKLPEVYPDTIEFQTGTYGWEISKLTSLEDKASYLFTSLIETFNYDEAVRIITEHLEPLGIKCFFVKEEDDFDNCYIDHGASYEFANKMANDDYAMIRFLFDEQSYVITSNDNCSDDVYDWYTNEINPAPDGEFIVYERGN